MRVAVLLLLTTTAAADSWIAFGKKVWIAPDGQHYMNGESNNGLAFELHARDPKGDPFGDKLVVKGVAPQLPLDVHVLSGEPAAILFEHYGQLGNGDTLARLDRNGKLVWRVELKKVDPQAFAGAKRTVSSIWWHRAWWVDEARGKVVLVAKNRRLNEVDLKTGKVTPAKKGVVFAAFKLPWACTSALEVAIEHELAGSREAAAPLAADETLPARPRALAALATGDMPDEIWDAGLQSKGRRYLILAAGKFLEDLERIEEAALRDEECGYAAALALKDREAARELAGLIAHSEINPKVRAYASQQLRQLPPEKVVKAVLREMKDAEPAAAGKLLDAAVSAGAGAEVLRQHETTMLEVLAKQTGPTAWLADYFRTHPTTEAVQPLLKALGKHKKDAKMRATLIAALKPCTGLNFGDDPDRWIRELAKR